MRADDGVEDGVEDDDDDNELEVASVDEDDGVEDEEDTKEEDGVEVLDVEGMGLTEPYLLRCCTIPLKVDQDASWQIY